MTTHSVFFPEKSHGQRSLAAIVRASQRVRNDRAHTHTHTHTHWVAISPLLFPSTPDNHHSISYIYLHTHCCCCCKVPSVVSDSVWPQRRQPTRLPCPWDSPGKNTGVACHFLLQCMKVKCESEVTQVVYLKVTQSCPTPRDPMDGSPPGSSVHGIFQARVLEWGAIAFSVTHTHTTL